MSDVVPQLEIIYPRGQLNLVLFQVSQVSLACVDRNLRNDNRDFKQRCPALHLTTTDFFMRK